MSKTKSAPQQLTAEQFQACEENAHAQGAAFAMKRKNEDGTVDVKVVPFHSELHLRPKEQSLEGIDWMPAADFMRETAAEPAEE